MKTPFRLQVSKFDCVPTTFVNAIVKLFDREEIPPLVIQRIYLYSLDSITPRQNMGHGTTGFAIQLLGNWLSEFKEKKFKVTSEYLTKKQVHFGRGKITECVNNGGVALLHIHCGKNNWHYILVLSIEKDKINCFDPYPKKYVKYLNGKVKFIEEDGIHSPNLIITRDHLETQSNSARYVLGTIPQRECLLLSRNN